MTTQVADRAHFGERLQALRDELGISGPELAEMTGVATGTLYRIENGKSKARGATLRRLARGLGMSVEELTGEVPKGERSPLELAREQAERLEVSEKKDVERSVTYYMKLSDQAKKGANATAKILRDVGHDPVKRHEALDLLDRFMAIEVRAEDRYWSAMGTSREEMLAAIAEEGSELA